MVRESRLCLTEDTSLKDSSKNGPWWSRRTRLERKLCLLSLLFFAALVGMGCCFGWFYFNNKGMQMSTAKTGTPVRRSTTNALTTESRPTATSMPSTTSTTTPTTTAPPVTKPPPPKVCVTEACVKAAGTLLSNMDQTKDPCTDFYEFACGGYIARTNIPDEKTFISQFSKLSGSLMYKVRDIINLPISEDDTKVDMMVKDFYASCMDLDKIAEIGLEPLEELIDGVGGWPVLMGDQWNGTDLTWQDLMYSFDDVDLSSNFFIELGIIRDFKTGSKNILALAAPHPGFPVSYLKRGKNDSSVQDHLQYMIETAVLLGANRTAAEKEMEEVLEFEMELIKYLKSSGSEKNISKVYNEMNVSQLHELNPEVDWVSYIKRLYPYEINGSEPIVVTSVNYTMNFTKLMKKTNIRVLANYAVGRIVRKMGPLVSDEFSQLRFHIFKKLSGVQQRNPRWVMCTKKAKSYFEVAIGAMYVKKFLKPEAKATIQEMVRLIREEMKTIIDKVTWADPKTIKRAKEKLEAVTAHVAYPEELLNYTAVEELYEDLTMKRCCFFENIRNISLAETDEYKESLREPVIKNDWIDHAAVAMINAFYNSLDNSISMPAGILQGLFFDNERPQYMNFAAIGTVVGHELTHGFDNSGRQFDSDGHLVNWWEPETNQKFKDRAECMVKQYSNYTPPEIDMKLKGDQNLGENIADNGGLKQSYYAYRTWAQGHDPELPLPGLNYTINQIFWLSFANVWCTKMRPESMKLLIEFGSHSIGRFRVNGPLSNMAAFSEDFQCPVDSPMNPTAKCSVW